MMRQCLSRNLVVAFLLAFGPPAPAADKALELVPPGTQVVLGLNVRALIDSPAFQTFVDLHGGEKMEAQLEVVKNLTGLDFMKYDLERVYLFAETNGNGREAIVFAGRFDEARLTALLKSNPKYESSAAGAVTIHAWHDEKENRMKYGAFLPEGRAILCNTRERLAECLAGTGDPAHSFLASPLAARIPAETATATVWAVLLSTEMIENNPDFPFAHDISTAWATAGYSGDTFNATATIQFATAQNFQDWVDLARGVVALGRLQQKEPALAGLAHSANVEPGADGRSVSLRLSAPLTRVLDLVREHGKRPH